MGDRKEFGELVRLHRKRQRLTQEALAALAFGNPDRKSYISYVENNRLRGITPETVRKIAEALMIARNDVPLSLRWSDEEDHEVGNPEASGRAESMAFAVEVGRDERRPARISPIVGLAVLLVVVVFNEELLAGLTSAWADVRPNGSFAATPLLAWSVTLLSLAFFFFGLEGRGAANRAAWIARGTWRETYLSTVSQMLDAADRFLFVTDYSPAKRNLTPSPNWSVRIYERVLALAVIYPVFLWMYQWAATGAPQNLGQIEAWPADPMTQRRVLICLCFSVTIPLALYASRFERCAVRYGLCLLGLALNFASYVYVWATYGGVMAGPGAINMVSVAFTLGIGFRLFDTVAVPAAAAALAGTILSFLFNPLVELAEFLTGNDGAGYRYFAVNVTHTIINHSLNIILFSLFVFTLSRFINRTSIETSPPFALATYMFLSVGTAILMLTSVAQQSWVAYYLLLGLVPIVNGLFDFLSISLTRYMIALGLQRFGWRTVAFSLLDLALAFLLFLALILSAICMVVLLNWAAGGPTIPLRPFQEACGADASQLLSPAAVETPAADACVPSVLESVVADPHNYAWLLAMFLSTLLPTAVHLFLALFALGPALLTASARRAISGWAAASGDDLFQRGAAALSLGIWLGIVSTTSVLVIERALWLLTGELGLRGMIEGFLGT